LSSRSHALGRVDQHKVAPLGELGIDQSPSGIECGLRVGIAPLRRREFGARLGAQDGVAFAQPAPMWSGASSPYSRSSFSASASAVGVVIGFLQ